MYIPKTTLILIIIIVGSLLVITTTESQNNLTQGEQPYILIPFLIDKLS